MVRKHALNCGLTKLTENLKINEKLKKQVCEGMDKIPAFNGPGPRILISKRSESRLLWPNEYRGHLSAHSALTPNALIKNRNTPLKAISCPKDRVNSLAIAKCIFSYLAHRVQKRWQLISHAFFLFSEARGKIYSFWPSHTIPHDPNTFVGEVQTWEFLMRFVD